MTNGVIVRAVSGFYYVRSDDGRVAECRARGRFKLEGITPLVGDNVQTENGVITVIKPRKNSLVRPTVSNIDNLIIVLSAGRPKPDMLLCDKLILLCLSNNIRPVICVNKLDQEKNGFSDEIKRDYACFDTAYVSAKDGTNLSELKEIMSHSRSAFAGQSAVGKTSILNAVFENADMETGELSRKTERGRHTTRKCELVYFDDFSGYIIDTPGFSSFDEIRLQPEELKLYYPDFYEYNSKCRYTSCMHTAEPECAVKEAVSEGKISAARYERYLKILQFLKEKRERQYD